MDGTPANREMDEAIFSVAMHIPEPELRDLFLNRSFEGDPEGLERMKDLLDSANDSTSFFLTARDACSDIATEILGKPSLATEALLSSHDSRAGTWIDCYQLGRCLGEGGSGTVYEAYQKEPVKRTVALKIVHIDTTSPSAQARFDIERQAMAIMDHPNIAKILDAGGISDGTAYFVMELVQGEPITHYCDRETLDVKERIRLVIDVCSAIQHAHSKGMIHRDIKPSNVLVTIKDQKPTPTVIDFGIAKAVASTYRNLNSFTAHDEFFGTPAYMSPEQVAMAGTDVDTRSDIYSLGVLLYELLTSHTPFDRKTLGSAGIAAMRSTLQNRNHPKPSAKLSDLPSTEIQAIASTRKTDPLKLVGSIRGDLDLIVMKALNKDRNDRYETANGLAMDLKRLLEDKPVTARRPSNVYLLTKFIQRNKIPVISVVGLTLSVISGFGLSTALYFREKSALKEQARLSHEAEQARDVQVRLRTQAQARADISRAAILLSDGQIEEADKLIQTNPLDSIEPSTEAAVLFRTFGRLYAKYGRWPESARCFGLMNQANKMAESNEILRGGDLISTAPALLEAEAFTDYENFRNNLVNRHLPVIEALSAEHFLKACLLRKASPAFLEQLRQPAAMCETEVRRHPTSNGQSWNLFALTLYYYRKGEFAKAVEMGTSGTKDPGIKEPCAVSLLAVLSLAHAELGAKKSAEDCSKLARSIFEANMANNPAQQSYPDRWYDWSTASLLLREKK